MGNEERRLNLVFGERIKGECWWYKMKVLGREKEGGVLLKKKGNPEKLEKNKERKERKGRGEKIKT